ncbi:F0F1 ATP synthase subunit B [Candidatus Microgenomates bacterium]|nr:F0F1 ATP synthase subunit B [Candidatus Microgenomates bacterium]
MEIINNFGIDPVLLLAQTVNFLILAYLLNRFFLKKILLFLREREQKIKSGLEAAQKGEELLEKAKTTQKEILSQAHAEAKKLLGESQIRSEELAGKMREKAELEGARILLEAQKATLAEGTKLKKDLEQQTARIAISIIERTLKSFLSEEENKKIVSNLYKKIKVVQ